MLAKLLVRLAFFIVVGLLAALLRQIPFIQPEPSSLRQSDLPRLTARYGKWDIAARFSFLAGLIASTWGAYVVLTLMAQSVQSLGPKPLFQYTIPASVYLLPAIGVGLLVAALVVDGLLRLVLKHDYDEYVAYLDSRYEVSNKNVSLLILFVLLLGCAILIPQMMRTHASFFPEEIRIRTFSSLNEYTQNYSDITKLSIVEESRESSGKSQNQRHFRIHFSDGKEWTSPSASNQDALKYYNLFQFLSRQTDLDLVTVRNTQDVAR